MNIIQAYSTGLPIRRAGWRGFFKLEYDARVVNIISNESYALDRDDILADDWEVDQNNRVGAFSMDSVWNQSPTLRSTYGLD